MAKTKRGSLITLVLLAALPFCACGDSDQIKKVKLRAASGPEEAGAGLYEESPLRISIAAMLSPKSSLVTYGELVQYIGKRLNSPVKVVFTKKYAETNDSLRNSGSDIAFICTGAYLAAREGSRSVPNGTGQYNSSSKPLSGDGFPLDIIAVPVVYGETVYNSVIVAAKNNPVRGLRDLKGKTFAFTDEFSLTGHLYIQARLAELKLTSSFFSGTIFTGSHDNSIKSVAEGFSDAASVDNLIYQALLRRGDFHAKQLKIIEKSPPFGIPPVVARHGLEAGLKVRVRAILLAMHKDEDGARILKKISIERFVTPAPELYSYAEKVYKGLDIK